MVPLASGHNGPVQTPTPSQRGMSRADTWLQIVLVLGVSLGASAVYAVLDLAEVLMRSSLADTTTTLNRPLSSVPLIDALRQLTGIGFALVPVLLALYLMAGVARGIPGVLCRIGVDGRRPVWDTLWGMGLFAVMGGGTLVLYQVGRSLGITAQITTSTMEQTWWAVSLLVLSALRHSIVEEMIVVAFLCERLRSLGWSWWLVAVASAVVRASYHLYQGFGPALGNLVMGLVFVWLYRRGGRLMPLLIAHALLDTVGFLAPQLLAG